MLYVELSQNLKVLYCSRMTKDQEWLLREKYKGEKTEGFFDDCTRLDLDEPLAYIIGTIPFLHTTISLDSHPLIPRTETEFWVEKIILDIKDQKFSDPRILDLCAGSGCIGVAILADVPLAHVDFAEIDVAHHSTIIKNISDNNIALEGANIYGGNLFEQISCTYDYILTNPPYIDPALDRTTESVKGFEPSLALYGGNAGTEIIFKIIEHALSFLNKDGKLIIEHEPEQSRTIQENALAHGYGANTNTDQFGLERYTVLIRK